jgi:tRNA(Ile)-lysidine synthase
MKKTEQKVLKFIDRNGLIEAGDKIIVAFSGGPDSVFALHFLNTYSKKFKIDLHAVHFNHGLRGKESDGDEKFAKDFCKKKSIPFISKKLNVKTFAKQNKLSIEEAARKLRYKNLEEINEKLKCSKIVTAHNQSDNTETILINLFSGSGLPGLSGIPVKRDNIIRPFLCLTKHEIVEYMEENEINFRIDKSNLGIDYKRNFLRNRIIPEIKLKLNPAVDEALFRSSNNLVSALQFNHKMAEHLAAQFVTHTGDSAVIWLYLADMFDGNIPAEIIKLVLKKYFKHEFEADDFEKINSLVTNQKGKQVQISKDLIAVREDESIKIEKTRRAPVKAISLQAGKTAVIGSKLIGIELVSNKSVQFSRDGKVEYISGNKLTGKFILREWKPGDKFHPLGMKNARKLSDFLTDLKIPSSERKKQLVLLNRNQIIWVVGLRIDNQFKLTEQTKKIYKLWVK